MNTVKHIILGLVVVLGSLQGFAASDGTAVHATAPRVNLNITLLIPKVPALAEFDEKELGWMTLILMDKVYHFAPSIPMEATFEEMVPEGSGLAPSVPMEAPIYDQL